MPANVVKALEAKEDLRKEDLALIYSELAIANIFRSYPLGFSYCLAKYCQFTMDSFASCPTIALDPISEERIPLIYTEEGKKIYAKILKIKEADPVKRLEVMRIVIKQSREENRLADSGFSKQHFPEL
jgi:hypothetical protein